MRPTTLPAVVADAGDVVDRAVGVLGVAQDHPVPAAQLGQGGLVADVAAQEVVDRDAQHGADADARR